LDAELARALEETLRQRFGALRAPTPQQLRAAMEETDVGLDLLRPHLGEPGIYPYGRKPLLSTDDVEIIVMNWAAGRICAPHDHGASFGWIRLVAGEVDHTLYTLDQNDLPVVFAQRREPVKKYLFAPRNSEGRTLLRHRLPAVHPAG
jgi:cysteine dioxygenase